jgi:glycerol-3-phosphate dehydrogenase (NAD(P)+)
MSVSILGGGAFGSAMAIALSRQTRVTLWARDGAAVAAMRDNGIAPRLAGVDLRAFRDTLHPTDRLDAALAADTILLATPMQAMSDLLDSLPDPLAGKVLVACSKGLDLATLTGPATVIARAKPAAGAAVLTGPSFAADIARGLPTALTLACADGETGRAVQHALSTATLRLYRSTDVAGAELGGALKNVVAIACGACMGAGLGDSARAALMTRGFSEMTRLAVRMGARPETLTGLSGFGDLALTCASDLSRNYRFGHALGRGDGVDTAATVEGVATAEAVVHLGRREGIELPICAAVHAIAQGRVTIGTAMQDLLTRPLKEE